MYGDMKRNSQKNTSVALDVVHLVLGVLIVVLAVLCFLNPEGNMMCFPLIFLLASALNGINSVYEIRNSGRDKKKRWLGVCQMVFSLALLALCVVSAVSIWR